MLLKVPPSEQEAEAGFEFMNEIETLVDVRNIMRRTRNMYETRYVGSSNY